MAVFRLKDGIGSGHLSLTGAVMRNFRFNRSAVKTFSGCILVALSACGGQGTPSRSDAGASAADSGQGLDASTARPDAGMVVSFSTQVLPILTASCTGYCHPGSYSPMSLRSEFAHQNLVSAPSVGCSDGRMRVKPGNAGTVDSYLMAKLRGVDLCGNNPMPPSGGPLSPDQIELIEAWISAGAPNN